MFCTEYGMAEVLGTDARNGEMPLESTLEIYAGGIDPDIVDVIRSALLGSMRDANAVDSEDAKPGKRAEDSRLKMEWPKFRIHLESPPPSDVSMHVRILPEQSAAGIRPCGSVDILIFDRAETKPKLQGGLIFTTRDFLLPRRVSVAYGKRLARSDPPGKRFLILLWYALNRVRVMMRGNRLALHFQRLLAERAVFGWVDLVAVSRWTTNNSASKSLSRMEFALGRHSPLFGCVSLEQPSRFSFPFADGGYHVRHMLESALKIASVFFRRPVHQGVEALRVVFEMVPSDIHVSDLYKQIYYTRESEDAIYCYVCDANGDVAQNADPGTERLLMVPSQEFDHPVALGMRLVDYVSQRMMLFSATPVVKSDKTEAVMDLVSDKPWMRAVKPIVEREETQNETLSPDVALVTMATYSKAVRVGSTDAFEQDARRLMGPLTTDRRQLSEGLAYDSESGVFGKVSYSHPLVTVRVGAVEASGIDSKHDVGGTGTWLGLYRDPATEQIRPFDFSLKEVLPPFCVRIWTVPQARRWMDVGEAFTAWRFQSYTDAQTLLGLHGQQAFDVLSLDVLQLADEKAITKSPVEAAVVLRGSGTATFGAARPGWTDMVSVYDGDVDEYARQSFNDSVLCAVGHMACVKIVQWSAGGCGTTGDPYWYTAGAKDELETIRTDKESPTKAAAVQTTRSSAYTKALRMAHRWLAAKASAFGSDHLTWFHERMVNPLERYERVKDITEAFTRGDETVLKDYLRRLQPFWVGL